ncbi:hypothetical protein ACP70R_036072 [Stipagrostis hirtigluma subsp. patula]
MSQLGLGTRNKPCVAGLAVGWLYMLLGFFFVLKFGQAQPEQPIIRSGPLALRSGAKEPRLRSVATMDAKIGSFFDAVGAFFSGGDNVPWCDPDVIAGCEREVAEAATEEQEKESIMRLSWALVHSRDQDHVNRGIGMLQARCRQGRSCTCWPLGTTGTATTPGAGSSWTTVSRIQPDWGQALSLKRTVEDKIAKDGVIGIGIATTAVGLLFGIAAAVARKN